MTSDLRDPLGHALDDLRDDVLDVPLAAPAQIRRRGDRRRRRNRAALGAGSALVAAAVVVGVAAPGLLRPQRPDHVVPPAGGAPSVTRTAPTPTPGGPTAPSSPADRTVVDVTPVGVGDVPPAYFLPGSRWSGADLAHGQQIRSTEVKEFEGSLQRFQCDPDTELTGDVAFVQAARGDGTIVGTQKVRLLGDATQAAAFVTTSVDRLGRCQQRLRQQAQEHASDLPVGEPPPTPSADVVEDASGRVDDATGSVRLYRTVTDYGTGPGSHLVEWVAVAREGSAVTFISINELEAGDVSFEALRRIASEARAQLAWAATR